MKKKLQLKKLKLLLNLEKLTGDHSFRKMESIPFRKRSKSLKSQVRTIIVEILWKEFIYQKDICV